ncbi:hypothetical protein E4T44_05052 [Aureobasidium sp. EXF-8845]|nr:hypothetical protein E4T45_08348 [Aureobasidium sp. EXF-8846]KAI4846460.1 hypothetical protein E4T44_05052 [Aureobasidium sp. EXF-8845]
MTAATDRHGHASGKIPKKKAHSSKTHKDKKEKKYVTTNAIFKSKPDQEHKRAKASTKGKTRSRREPSSSPPPPKKYTLADKSNGMAKLLRPSWLPADSLLEMLNKYRGHVVDDSEQMIDLAYKNLIQKLDKTTLGPDALNTRIADAIEAAEDAFKPFADTKVGVVYRDSAGKITGEAEVPIGDTFGRFNQKLQKTKDGLEKLWKEWEDVRQEIAETGAQILHDPKFPSQFGLEAVNSHSSPSSGINPEVENLRRPIKRESEKSHKELDQEAKDAINKHKEYQNMWRSWLQDELN